MIENEKYDIAHKREFFETDEAIQKYQKDAQFLIDKVGAHC